ncbi:MAG: hypothetical protein ABFC34_05320 [Methanobacterium sp.]
MNFAINLLLTIIIAIIFKYSYLYLHEGGHYLAAKLPGFKNVKIGYTKYKFPIYIEIDDDELEKIKNVSVKILFITICGPLVGLIPFITLYFVVRNVGDVLTTVLMGAAILLYLKDCRKDFEQIVESVRMITME